MKIELLAFALFTSLTCYAQSEELEDFQVTNITTVISLFKQKQPDKISSMVDFPLRRSYPIPSIKSKDELIKRFDEVFDSILVEQIANSKIEQWSEVGWRGITLDAGTIWLDRDGDKIRAVNYQSDYEKELQDKLIELEKSGLHPSLKEFKKPTYRIETKHYFIRIDELPDYKYRYSSWKIGEKETLKPDIILFNGYLEFLGSGGNHVFTFSNQNYIYKVYRNLVGEEDSPDFTIEVERDGEIILTEGGILIVL
jgi:hypothetical protein